MDFTTKEAEDLLKLVGGNLTRALLECTKPASMGSVNGLLVGKN